MGGVGPCQHCPACPFRAEAGASDTVAEGVQLTCAKSKAQSARPAWSAEEAAVGRQGAASLGLRGQGPGVKGWGPWTVRPADPWGDSEGGQDFVLQGCGVEMVARPSLGAFGQTRGKAVVRGHGESWLRVGEASVGVRIIGALDWPSCDSLANMTLDMLTKPPGAFAFPSVKGR